MENDSQKGEIGRSNSAEWDQMLELFENATSSVEEEILIFFPKDKV